MYETHSISEKLKLFTIILLPILITQVAMNLMSFFDTVMSGQSGADDLAGVAIGSSFWIPVSTGLNGIMLAITPIIAHHLGAKEDREVPNVIQQGIYLAITISVAVVVFGALLLEPLIQLMNLEDSVAGIAKYYLIAIGTGIIPLFIFNTIRAFMDGLGQTRASMFIILLSLPINIFLNYIFIFGKLGLPALGGIGAGIASSLTYWIVAIIGLLVMHKIQPFAKFRIFESFFAPSLNKWAAQLKIGVPIGLAIFLETSIFSVVTLLMSVYNTYTIAAHQAAMNFASLLYMIPLSVGMALTIAVGFEVGAKRFDHAKTYSYIGMSGGVFIAFFAGAILYIFNEPVAKLYNSNPEVVERTIQFIYFAIFYQLADAFGAPIQGILRGYKDVNVTLVLALVSYWGIGLPIGYYLANNTALEPFGYWVGIIVGLSVGAVALLLRLLQIQKRFELPTA